ncbi:unnamed protein product [Menidia menidia]|uniref:(Atlantic silverside) hypothetical protein n=1 Tax=Menidia menidia TaxID=238744 RepID=A0A8S4B006_9TELE|nr:unnamed protein product [Menidia menidia]
MAVRVQCRWRARTPLIRTEDYMEKRKRKRSFCSKKAEEEEEEDKSYGISCCPMKRKSLIYTLDNKDGNNDDDKEHMNEDDDSEDIDSSSKKEEEEEDDDDEAEEKRNLMAPGRLLPVTCGTKKGILVTDRLDKGEDCIECEGRMLSPTAFEEIGGRASSRKWKASISYKNKPLMFWLESGFLSTKGYRKLPSTKTQKEIPSLNVTPEDLSGEGTGEDSDRPPSREEHKETESVSNGDKGEAADSPKVDGAADHPEDRGSVKGAISVKKNHPRPGKDATHTKDRRGGKGIAEKPRMGSSRCRSSSRECPPQGSWCQPIDLEEDTAEGSSRPGDRLTTEATGAAKKANRGESLPNGDTPGGRGGNKLESPPCPSPKTPRSSRRNATISPHEEAHPGATSSETHTSRPSRASDPPANCELDAMDLQQLKKEKLKMQLRVLKLQEEYYTQKLSELVEGRRKS